MELNDKVRITLTLSGAKFLIEKAIREGRRAMRCSSLSQKEIGEIYHLNYHENQVLRIQLHRVFGMFRGFPHFGNDFPFTNLELDNDKRCSCRASVRVSQVT